MSIQTEINRISQSKVDIVSALEYQEVNVPTNTTIDEIAPLIRQISRSEDLSAELNTQGTLLNTQTGKISDAINLLKGKAVSSGGEISLQEKTVSPSKTTQLVTPDSDYDGLSKVTVNAVTSSIDSNITASNIKSGVSILGVEGTLEEGITPSGELKINDNGVYNVTNYASANVEIEKGITPSGTLEITENGTFDVTEYASANVNVASSGGGGDELVGSIVDRTVTEIINSDATSVGEYSLRSCTKLITVDFPNATSVGQYAFAGCSVLENVTLPSVESVGQYAFNQCNKLRSIILPSATTLTSNAFRDTQYIEIIDLPKLTDIPATTFYGCRGLKALLLRSTTLVTLANTSAFTTCYRILGTKNAGFNPNGEKIGFIYVPRALIEDYKVATNWSSDSLVTQFRALEDYTIDGTITGALDKTKI